MQKLKSKGQSDSLAKQTDHAVNIYFQLINNQQESRDKPASATPKVGTLQIKKKVIKPPSEKKHGCPLNKSYKRGFDGVFMPFSFNKKNKSAGKDFAWC
jgi:hypothetical protein